MKRRKRTPLHGAALDELQVQIIEQLTEGIAHLSEQLTMARQPIGDALAIAQHNRTQARLTWIDHLIDGLIVVFPEKRTDLEAVRIDLHQENARYVETLNAADMALINRVTAIVMNEQLAREAGDDALQKQIGGTS